MIEALLIIIISLLVVKKSQPEKKEKKEGTLYITLVDDEDIGDVVDVVEKNKYKEGGANN